ncbi:glycosyltransferase family 2 protein [Seonamhaeicola algicola]|uniref:Glycosyltransferase family 2 protein n=1 Tax=Seonamhaeicola algicola TaxID=1719036 RepID=A0A5C7AWG3_9FLAO|nr:glycosyltransferase family A protein [Seonamhaeicola algicola]TXE12033.1 glycosyltransferase family 2 protein [Seonamhaeicola algicola]
MNKLAVILPTYNSAHFLKESIGAILNQSFKEFELFIIDDCSTDNTEQFVQNIDDNRVKYIKNSKNLGLAATLNKGLKLLVDKYEYIARMDADDWCYTNRFEKQISFLEAHNDIVLCGTQGYWLRDFNVMNSSSWSYPTDNLEIKYNLLFTACFGHSSVIFRTSFLKENKIWYNESIDTCEDWDLWTRIIKQGKVANLPDFLMKYRIVDNSNHRAQENREKHLRERSKVIASYWQSFNISSNADFIYNSYYSSKSISKKEFEKNILTLIKMFNVLNVHASKELSKDGQQILEYRCLRSILRAWVNSGITKSALGIWFLILKNVKFTSKLKIIKSIIK